MAPLSGTSWFTSSNRNVLLIVLIAGLSFIPSLGGAHLFEWDEINFAEIAREMNVLDDYLRIHVGFLPFAEKPPLFFWLQALFMKLFGVGEFAARLPNALCGIITLAFLYKTGERFFSPRFGWLWAGAYYGMFLGNFYFRSGIIDPWFNLFIFLGLYHLILATWKRGQEQHRIKRSVLYHLALAGVCTGLAFLTKGPVALLLTGLTLLVYWITIRFRWFLNPGQLVVYLIVALVVPSLWFGVETAVYGSQFVRDFTIRQWELFSQPDAGHSGFPGYHFVLLLIGCFPASVFFIRSHFKLDLSNSERDLRRWMLILFWVVLILFTIVQSKIIHYSSMAYFPLTFLAALVADQLIAGKIRLAGWMKTLFLVLGMGAGLLVLSVPYVGNHIEILEPLFRNNPFALANLQSEVHWNAFHALPGLLLIAIIITSYMLLVREKLKLAFTVLFGGIGAFVWLGTILFINKIEGYTQEAMIRFYQDKQDCDCYVVAHGFKSYGALFYSRVMPGDPIAWPGNAHLKYDDIDRDVYFVSKVNTQGDLPELDDVEFLYEENGYSFWLRSAR